MIDQLLIAAYDCLWRLVWRPEESHPELISVRHRPFIAELAAKTPRFGPIIDLPMTLAAIRSLCVETEALHHMLAARGVPIPMHMPSEIAALASLAEAVACSAARSYEHRA